MSEVYVISGFTNTKDCKYLLTLSINGDADRLVICMKYEMNLNMPNIDLENVLYYWEQGSFSIGEWDIEFDAFDRQFIEEICYLCVHPNFLNDIHNLREKIFCWTNTRLPERAFTGAFEILEKVYHENYLEYRKSIEDIVSRYKLVKSFYWFDFFESQECCLNAYLDEPHEVFWADCCARSYSFGHNPIKRLSNENLKDFQYLDISLLDRIILCNQLIFKHEMPIKLKKYHSRRASSAQIDLKESNSIIFHFPLYATVEDAKKIISDCWPSIQQDRQSITPVLKQKDHRKKVLNKDIKIFQMYVDGRNNEGIATELDEGFHPNATDIVTSADGVRKSIQRTVKELKRFG